MKLGYALREARFKRFPNKEKNAGDIAAEVGITATYFSQVELGKKEPSYDLVKSLCKLYKIPVPVLFWMALEPTDIQKNKREAFEMIKGPMVNLINEFF